MVIYLVLLFIVVMCIQIAVKEEGKVISRLFYFGAFLALILVSTMRSSSVGTDSGSYVNYFNNINSFAAAWGGDLEPGYYFLCRLAHFISNNYISVFFVTAFVVTLCFFVGIYLCSAQKEISFFVLLTSGSFFFFFNGARQGLAIAIIFLATYFLLKRNFWGYLGCVAVAFLFHKTAIIGLVAYFLVNLKNHLKYKLLLMAAIVIGIVFFDKFVDLVSWINPPYATYGEIAEESHGLLSLFFISAVGAYFVIYQRYIAANRQIYDILLKIFLLGVTMAIFAAIQGVNIYGIRRLSMYFTTAQILLWPVVFTNIKKPLNRRLFLFFFISCYLLYYSLALNAFSNLVPYTFNPLVTSLFEF